VSAPELRASDADRERVVIALREHTVAGRLTLEEFADRMGRAYEAKAIAELDELGRDLPAPATASRRSPTRFTGVVFGSAERTGRLRLPRRSRALVVFGDVDLDLRRAELSGDVASFSAFLLFGNIDVYVPERVEVDLGGLTVFGHRREWGSDVPSHAAAPLLRVKVYALFGTADVWRVPASWVGHTFGEVIRGMRRGKHRELPQ
jgi:Domain of unknown function (DUF1707)